MLRSIHDDAIRSQYQAGDRRGVLQAEPGDLGGIDDAHRHHVAEFAGSGIVAERIRPGRHPVQIEPPGRCGH